MSKQQLHFFRVLHYIVMNTSTKQVSFVCLLQYLHEESERVWEDSGKYDQMLCELNFFYILIIFNYYV